MRFRQIQNDILRSKKAKRTIEKDIDNQRFISYYIEPQKSKFIKQQNFHIF